MSEWARCGPGAFLRWGSLLLRCWSSRGCCAAVAAQREVHHAQTQNIRDKQPEPDMKNGGWRPHSLDAPVIKSTLPQQVYVRRAGRERGVIYRGALASYRSILQAVVWRRNFLHVLRDQIKVAEQ